MTNETIADIVAAKRSVADQIEREAGEAGRNLCKIELDFISLIRADADLIEAVWKCKRARRRTNPKCGKSKRIGGGDDGE